MNLFCVVFRHNVTCIPKINLKSLNFQLKPWNLIFKSQYSSLHNCVNKFDHDSRPLTCFKRACVFNFKPYSLNVRQFSFHSFIVSIALSQPVLWGENFLISCHNLSNLPWWANIVVTTVVLRTFITLPLAIFQNYTLARVENLQPEIKNLAIELKKEVTLAIKLYKWDEKRAKYEYKRNLKRHINKLIVRDNCHPFKAFLIIWIQFPLWICLSFALRNISGFFPIPGMVTDSFCFEMSWEGALWFPNLLIPDSTWIIPLIFGLSNLAILEIHAAKRSLQATRIQKGLTYLFRFVSVLMVPIAASVPTSMSLYWTCSSLFGLGQNIILMYPHMRRLFRIPKTPSESNTPFTDLIQAFKSKRTIGKKE